MLFNSRLKLFPRKLRSWWSGPFEMKEVTSYGAVEMWSEFTSPFMVNGQILKHYMVDEPIEMGACITLKETP